MPWHLLVFLSAGGLALAAVLCIGIIRWLGRREPHGAFIRLPNRHKLRFCWLLLRDRRVPLLIKLLPLAVLVYLINPIDFLPGLVLDDIAVALLALVLIIRFTPRPVLEDLIRQAAGCFDTIGDFPGVSRLCRTPEQPLSLHAIRPHSNPL